MTEPHHPTESHDHAHHEEHISDNTFMKVFGALCVATVLTFSANLLARVGVFGTGFSFVIIGLIAIIKATLVVAFFMHLKIDWKKLFVFIVPVMVLAPMMVIVLFPDIVLAWRLAPAP